MKICFITSTIFNLGGVQRVVSVLASKLIENYEVDIICTDKNFEVNRNLYNLDSKINIKINSELLNKKKTSRIIGKIFREFNSLTGIFNNKRMIDILTYIYYPNEIRNNFINYLNSQSYDIVIGVEGYYSLLLGIISDNITAKTIGWQHNSYDAYLRNKNRYYWNQDELFNTWIQNLDIYLVLSEYDRKMFLKENNIESIVMHNPRSFSSPIKSDVSKKQFLAAGRFNYQKGFDLLIESFYEFSKKNNDWNLVIVGEGEEKFKILEQINKYKLSDRISLEPFTNDIKKYFLESSVLLLSSRWEGMPMIVLESLEMGVPIIAYDITAVEALIDNEREGLIIEKFDTKKFAESMYKISKSYEMRYKLSQNAINKSRQFEISNIAKQWDSLINYLNKNEV